MPALRIRRRRIAQPLAGIRARGLAARLGAVVATLSGPRLTRTESGRRFGGGSDLRHRINRADRPLCNVHWQRDARGIYRALVGTSPAGVAELRIVIDWSDLKGDHSLHRLRAWLTGRGSACSKVYRQRMPIELSFRDMKSQCFSEGLECGALSGAGRYRVLVLIASLSAVLQWLIGTVPERAGVHGRTRPGSRQRLTPTEAVGRLGKLCELPRRE